MMNNQYPNLFNFSFALGIWELVIIWNLGIGILNFERVVQMLWS